MFAKDTNGYTPLDWAERKGHLDVVNKMRKEDIIKYPILGELHKFDKKAKS